MKIDETKKNQVFVIEQSGQAVHLGGCGNPNQANRLVNAGLKEGKVPPPLHPGRAQQQGDAVRSIRLVPAVKSPSTPAAERPALAQAG
jgi:hypothetical protein